MANNEGLKSVIEDIEILLDGILLSGVSVVGEGTLKEVNRIAVNCNELGLKEGGAMLFKLKEDLMRKNHTLNFDLDELVRSLALLGSYVSLVKDKMKGKD
ncbi:hypothetical protein NNC19_18365 [Clostridium sp. SHJSY1]|uniref:hypothetical protein n=1 Tax=Clostridium sp. SHJSY1 TaxID=2942483 RepID=UPI002876AF63|nr:hypothetical protein [Clostridium sp. SHJSY1]MDS0527657.1 hypothetical protein [Clostridium sp. SHJSY1]